MKKYLLRDEKGVLKAAMPQLVANMLIFHLDVEAQGRPDGGMKFVVKDDFTMHVKVNGVGMDLYLWKGDYLVEATK